ncbi:MAG: D-glycero-beta-D-manno-heptose 1,7-bisphosphate 7-phosphatase [Anaerolineales bacterium]|nr:D-glycero-beta-D-manno-heptose 1,7-bisphosphate 7-phosphatase [Anaerolineales bacterium]
MFPAIFLDRDGVIIENRPNYVRSWQDVSLIPGVLEALASLSTLPYKIVIVTNQSAIGRGLVALKTAKEINQRLLRLILNSGGRVDGLFMCPHAPEDRCACRKPQPGLLLQAAHELSLDLQHSILIGDAWSDLQAGKAAGVPNLVLLRTGRGADQLKLPAPSSIGEFQVFNDLMQAVKHLRLDEGAQTRPYPTS